MLSRRLGKPATAPRKRHPPCTVFVPSYGPVPRLYRDNLRQDASVCDGLHVSPSGHKIVSRKNIFAFWRDFEFGSTSWGSQVRVPYRPHHKAFPDNELGKAFVFGFCKESVCKGICKGLVGWEVGSAKQTLRPIWRIYRPYLPILKCRGQKEYGLQATVLSMTSVIMPLLPPASDPASVSELRIVRKIFPDRAANCL